MTTALRRRLPVLVAALAAVPFLPALGGGFLHWDDAKNLLEHDRWRGLAPARLHWMLTTFHTGPYMPLTWLTYGLDFVLWGLSPAGFHATSLLIHAASAGLLYGLADDLLRRGAPDAAAAERAPAAAFAALFWAVHPLRVESAAWISERRDVLCGLLTLLALREHLRRPGGLRELAAFAAALLAKGSAVTLPLLFLVLDVWPLRRPPRRALLEKVPLLLLSLGFGIAGLIGQSQIGALHGLAEAGWGRRLALAVYGLGYYLARTAWPAGLTPFHPVPAGFGPASPSVVAGAAAAAALAAAAWRARRRRPAVPAALAHYALALAPLLGLVRFGGQLVADRYSYVAALGPSVLAGGALLLARRRAPRAASAAAALVLLGLGALTWRYSACWRGDLELWSRAAAVDPGSTVARVNLADALRRAGREDEAAAQDELSIRLDPGQPEVLSNLAAARLRRGRPAEAEALARRAVLLQPASVSALRNLGSALIRQGRWGEAVPILRRALELDPGAAAARNDLGLALTATGRAVEAERQLAAAAAGRPDWAVPRYNRGNALAALGRGAEAARDFDEAARLDPAFEAAWLNAGNAWARRGRLAEAARRWRRALELDPSDAAARDALRQVEPLLRRGR